MTNYLPFNPDGTAKSNKQLADEGWKELVPGQRANGTPTIYIRDLPDDELDYLDPQKIQG